MNYAAVKDYLFSLRHHKATYGIDRMAHLVERLGRPDRRFPIIHVAGTNGKGSVCAILESLYRAHGYSTGMFTSPHLIYLGERVQVNRQPLPARRIADYTGHLRAVAAELGREDADKHPSFFEFVTAMALLRFAEEPVDIGIIEVGLGGRLDATNVVEPEVSVITSIDFDHTELLGDTLGKIAREKAGILKPGRPVVLGPLPAEAEDTILSIARSRGCPVHRVVDRFPRAEDYPVPALEGPYQRVNAATAVLVTEVLGRRFPLSPAARAQGLAAVSWAARWQSEPLADGRRLILDATHNPQGARELDRNLELLRAEHGRRPVVMTGILGEFRAKALMPVLARHAAAIHLLRPAQPRACEYGVLERLVPPDFRGELVRSEVPGLFPEAGVCAAGGPEDVLVATGSIYLMGEILGRLRLGNTPGEPELQDVMPVRAP